MNPNTGELRRIAAGDEMPEGFEALPRGLDKLARLKLAMAAAAGIGMAHTESAQPDPMASVNLRSTTPLARWAKKKRLAKIAAKSRRRNRR